MAEANAYIVTQVEVQGQVVKRILSTPFDVMGGAQATIKSHAETLRRGDITTADEERPTRVQALEQVALAAVGEPSGISTPLSASQAAATWARAKPLGATATTDDICNWLRENGYGRFDPRSLGNSIPKNARLKSCFQQVEGFHPARWRLVKKPEGV